MSLEVFAYLLSLISVSVAGAQWLGLRAALAHFTGAATGPCRTPMTLIRPVRGFDDGLEAGLRALDLAARRAAGTTGGATEEQDDDEKSGALHPCLQK